MPQAQEGKKVQIHYTGRLADGTVFDSSEGREPLEFTLGEGQVIPGFDSAVTGMEPGQEQTVTIPSEQAYGERRKDLVFSVPREQFPPDISPEVGQRLQMQQGEQVAVVVVQEVADAEVTLDANHPLAGEDLTFEVQLVDVVG
ncbi:MAG: peptidylprolyl isomerase [Gemmatimonadota bacterium]